MVCANTVLAYWLRRQLPGLDAVGIAFDALVNSAKVPHATLDRYTSKCPASGPARMMSVMRSLSAMPWNLLSCWSASVASGTNLIVDELQYFNRKAELNILDLALKGGLSEGRWAMFGDFYFQNWLVENNRIAAGQDVSAHAGGRTRKITCATFVGKAGRSQSRWPGIAGTLSQLRRPSQD